jgi:HEAT repeat protein
MVRAALFLLAVCFLSCTTLVAQEKEKKKDPLDEKILNKTIGEWIQILRTHENPKFRLGALIALEVSDSAGRTGLPALLSAIEKDKSPQVRQEAVMLLGRLGPKTNGGIQALVASLQTDKADEVREAAATAIGNKFVDQAVAYLSVLTDTMKDPHDGTRIAAAGALRNMGEAAKPALPILLEAAKNPKEHPQVRAAALHVVSRLGKDNPQTVPLLLELLKNSATPAALREAAADGLGRSGSDSADVVNALGQTLGDKNLELRKAVAIALGTLGNKAKAAWPDVKERLSDAKEDSSVRNHLIRLTGTFAKNNAEAVKALTDAAVNDKSTENRIAAIQELGELGTLPKETRDTLRSIANQDARAAIREAAAKALKQVGG